MKFARIIAPIIAMAQAASIRSKTAQAPERRHMQRRSSQDQRRPSVDQRRSSRPAAVNQQMLRMLRNQSYSSPYELFY